MWRRFRARPDESECFRACCSSAWAPRETDSPGLYPGQAGATVTRGCAGLNWLGGELMGKGPFATSCEIAGFMGISSRLGPCVAIARL